MRYVFVCTMLALAASCAQGGQGTAQSAADRMTKAVYADDLGGVTAEFSNPVKGQVTRASLGVLSDEMHALGAYRGITYVDGDPVKQEYTYRLTFDRGVASAVVRLDPAGGLAAYRLFPQS